MPVRLVCHKCHHRQRLTHLDYEGLRTAVRCRGIPSATKLFRDLIEDVNDAVRDAIDDGSGEVPDAVDDGSDEEHDGSDAVRDGSDAVGHDGLGEVQVCRWCDVIEVWYVPFDEGDCKEENDTVHHTEPKYCHIFNKFS